MALKVTVTHADAEKDAEFSVVGLGLFVNGKAREVSDDEAAAFKAANGYDVKDIKADYIKVEGTTAKATGGDN